MVKNQVKFIRSLANVFKEIFDELTDLDAEFEKVKDKKNTVEGWTEAEVMIWNALFFCWCRIGKQFRIYSKASVPYAEIWEKIEVWQTTNNLNGDKKGRGEDVNYLDHWQAARTELEVIADLVFEAETGTYLKRRKATKDNAKDD